MPDRGAAGFRDRCQDFRPLNKGMTMARRRVGNLTVLILIACCTIASAAPASDTGSAASTSRRRILLDADWSFHLVDIRPGNQAISADYNDASSLHVDLPHDYVLDGTYTPMDDKPGR